MLSSADAISMIRPKVRSAGSALVDFLTTRIFSSMMNADVENIVLLKHPFLQATNFWPYWSCLLHLLITASTFTGPSPHLQSASSSPSSGKSFASSSCLSWSSFIADPNNWLKVKLGQTQTTLDGMKNTLHNPNMNFSQPESSPEEIKINLWPRKVILNVRFNQEDLLRLTELSRI